MMLLSAPKLTNLRRSAAQALRLAGLPERVIMAAGGWKTPAMFRRYPIVSASDQRAAVEMRGAGTGRKH